MSPKHCCESSKNNIAIEIPQNDVKKDSFSEIQELLLMSEFPQND